eukprot:COSAG03_NODE_249_length_10010_cov_12.956715_5_plen_87_part_00
MDGHDTREQTRRALSRQALVRSLLAIGELVRGAGLTSQLFDCAHRKRVGWIIWGERSWRRGDSAQCLRHVGTKKQPRQTRSFGRNG